jgi:hypothetical protein
MINGDGCNNDCLSVCGDGTVDPNNGEDCDRGLLNTNTACVPGYGDNCNYCQIPIVIIICSLDPVAVTGHVDANNGEDCDRGLLNTNTACVPGYGDNCNYCDTNCNYHLLVGPRCGDGNIDNPPETCDDGINDGGTETIVAYPNPNPNFFPFFPNSGTANRKSFSASDLGLNNIPRYYLHRDNIVSITFPDIIAIAYPGSVTSGICWTDVDNIGYGINSPDFMSVYNVGCNLNTMACSCPGTDCHVGKIIFDAEGYFSSLEWNGWNSPCHHPHLGFSEVHLRTRSCYNCGACASELINNTHTAAQCTAGGGQIINVGGCNNVCRFNSAFCPGGWTQYGNWSTTADNQASHIWDYCSDGWHACRTCNYLDVGDCQAYSIIPTIGSHSWSNTAVESCLYNSGEGVCGNTLYSTITQIGCY